MNGPMVVAQAGAPQTSNAGAPGSSSTPVQIIKVVKPPQGQTEVFHASFNGTVKIDLTAIANEKITLYHDNTHQTLHVIFADGAQAVIEPFFDSMGVLSNFVIEAAPNQDLTGAQFAAQFPISSDQSVLPAAGATGSPASGADFHDPTVSPFLTPTPLPLLPPEVLPPVTFTNTAGALVNSAVVLAPPTSIGDFGSTNEDSSLVVTAKGVLANDLVGQAGDTLTVSAVNGVAGDVGHQIVLASGATLTLNADGSYTYNPDTAAFRTTTNIENLPVGSTYNDAFSYTATDNHGNSSTTTVHITVNVPPEIVTAADDYNATNEDSVLNVAANSVANVLHNDNSGSDDPLVHVTAVNGVAGDVGHQIVLASGATLTLNADGSYTYNPDTAAFRANTGIENLPVGSHVSDSFTYTAVDGHGDASTATVHITVNVPPETVTAVNDFNATREDVVLHVAANSFFNVLHNDNAAAGDDPFVHVSAVNGISGDVGHAIVLASGATLTLNADGSYIYDPTTSAAFELLPENQTTNDSFTYTAVDGHGDSSTATVNMTITGDRPPDPTGVDIHAIANTRVGFFRNGDPGNLEVKATFPSHPLGETHTILIQLHPGFVTSDLHNGSGVGWHDGLTNTTYSYAYNYDQTNGVISVQIPDSLAGVSVDLNFDITAPSTGTLPSTLNFTATASSNPLGDTFDGTSVEDTASASASTAIPSGHLLSGNIVTNSSVVHQEMVLSVVDQANPLDAYSVLIDTAAQGQHGALVQDAGFNINSADHYLVGLDQPFQTSKIIITDFTLNGVTMDEAHGNIQLEAFDQSGGVHGFTAVMQPNGPGLVTGHDSFDTTANGVTLSDPTPSNGSLDFLFGGGNNNVLNGSSDSEFLAATGTGSTVNGGPGTDVMIYNPGNTYNGGDGFDILRIDQGAIYNTHVEDPLASANGLISAAVDLSSAHITSIDEILLTQEATPNPSLGTDLSGLSVSQVEAITDATSSVTGSAHSLFVVGSAGDNVTLATGAGGWTEATGAGSTYSSAGGQLFHLWTPTGGGGAAHLFIDNDLTVNHVAQ